MRRRSVLWVMLLASTQVYASCSYSPPPVLSHGQGADTLGTSHWAVAAEAGWGTNASWWTASNLGHPEVKSGWVGVGRFRYGLDENVDVGVVSGRGPLGTTLIGPELKWRFLHLSPENTDGAPGFHAAWVSGMAVGSSRYPYEAATGTPDPRHCYLAPYTGVLGSGGIEEVRMFTGFRLAASETLSNHVTDLTLYPTVAFGVLLQPAAWLEVHAEADLAAGITTHDIDDTGILAYPSLGLTVRQ